MANTNNNRIRRACCLLGAAAALLAASLPTLAAERAPTVPATFTKDVAPIFQEKCQTCHRPDGGAPFSLLTYQDARPWARAIKLRVERREMPPWHIDKKAGVRRFKDDPSLTDAQLATIVRWVDEGAPEGNRADMPVLRSFPPGNQWEMGTPDLTVTPAKDHVMYAQGMDWWIDFVLDPHLTEDRWIKAVEVHPGNRQIVHHMAVYQEPPAEARRAEDANAPAARSAGEGASTLMPLYTYAPGKPPDIYGADTGLLIKAGTKIRLSFHYSTVGKEVSDRTVVGFRFLPKGVVPKYQMFTAFIDHADLEISPNSITTHDAYFRLAKAARIDSFAPHMHMRGKASTLEAILPNGRTELLSYVDRYDFRWQITYAYADDAAPLLPAGTFLHVIAVHDNTAANRNNPDPDKWVGWGQASQDEMSAGFVSITYLDDDEYEKQLSLRTPKQNGER